MDKNTLHNDTDMTYEMYNTEIMNEAIPEVAPGPMLDYSEILDKLGLSYSRVGYHLQVGEITLVQGWILHISVVRSEIGVLLNLLIPVLVSRDVAFKIIRDQDTAKTLLDGDFGGSLVGKIISLYPTSPEEAIALANICIPLCKLFKGPAVNTDVHLGGNVYTRYGSFNPLMLSDAAGKEDRYIYDPAGNLIPDKYTSPFALPEGIEWPFGNFASPLPAPRKKVFHEIYKPISLLKSDSKGDVIKALYLKHYFFVKWCVIKQGKKNMWSDDYGRDITDRLQWQKELHAKLSGFIPLPKILDLFVEEGDTHLTMEYIKGVSLYKYVTDLNYPCCTWEAFPIKKKLLLLDFLLTVCKVIGEMHQHGFVHRDITPVNFLVDKKGRLFLIDIELAYSLSDQLPYPPFEFGTYGFMSPEQMEMSKPTVKEDVYGLGATILTLIVGLPPSVFPAGNKELLHSNLSFFIRNKEMVDMMTACLAGDPADRTDIRHIEQTIRTYRCALDVNGRGNDPKKQDKSIDENKLRFVIEESITGLVLAPTLINKDLWQSRLSSADSIPDSQRKGFGKSGGLYEGITGVLYFLGKAKGAGFDISACMTAYNKGWEYIKTTYLNDVSNLPPGLYGGAAGMALALISGLDAGLLQNDEENRQYLQQCLTLDPVALDVKTGAAGQGIGRLQAGKYLPDSVLWESLRKCVDLIYREQQKEGYWVMIGALEGKQSPAASFAFGNTGITWFLLEYAARYKDDEAHSAAVKSLAVLIKLSAELNRSLVGKGFRDIVDNAQTWDGITGLVLCFLKAFELFRDEKYKQCAESLLAHYPDTLVHENFNQDVGMAGVGELYLEMYRVLKDDKWRCCAEWIAQFLVHTAKAEAGGGYHWIINNAGHPTADFMVGNSGIIHFLIRFLSPERLNYRILK